MRPQPLETNLLILARLLAARQLAFLSLLTLLIPLRPPAKEHFPQLRRLLLESSGYGAPALRLRTRAFSLTCDTGTPGCARSAQPALLRG
jgi:hypothetical protein